MVFQNCKMIKKEGNVMSKMDNCLFYRVTDVETTFKVLFVDDTLKFSQRQEDID
jgi:hypothetical protein